MGQRAISKDFVLNLLIFKQIFYLDLEFHLLQIDKNMNPALCERAQSSYAIRLWKLLTENKLALKKKTKKGKKEFLNVLKFLVLLFNNGNKTLHIEDKMVSKQLSQDLRFDQFL